MIAVLLILFPLLGGLISFFYKDDRTSRVSAVAFSLITLIVSVLGLTYFKNSGQLEFHADWISNLNTSFSVKLDGMGQILCLLTAISYPLVFISTWNSQYKRTNNFFAFMLLIQVWL